MVGSINPENVATKPAMMVVTVVTIATLIQSWRLGTMARESNTLSFAAESNERDIAEVPIMKLLFFVVDVSSILAMFKM